MPELPENRDYPDHPESPQEPLPAEPVPEDRNPVREAAGKPTLDYAGPRDVEDDKLISIAMFGNAFEANLAAEKLRSEGIICHLTNENAASLGLPYAMLDGGIKLLVRAGDQDEAKRLLPKDRRRDEHHPCPICREETQKLYWPMPLRVLSWCLLGIPYIFIDARWRCGKCGHTFVPDPNAWDEEEEEDPLRSDGEFGK
jgi:hypothetical protein